jgi:DNA-binding transcriptional LysR family regulator
MTNSKLDMIKYCDDQLVAVLNRDHPLASMETIDLKYLEKEPLLFMGMGTPTYGASYSICREAGFTPNVFFYGYRSETILDLAEKNMGIGILFEKLTQIPHKNLVTRKIFPTAKRTIYLVRIANHDHSEEAEIFWNYIANLTGKQTDLEDAYKTSPLI